MSARQDIAKLLEQWREYTEAEAGAIEAAAWPALKEIQAAKSGLQRSITETMRKWETENRGKGKPPFLAEVNRLIVLEARNSELLAAHQRRARLEMESQDSAVRNLRKVRKSYGASSDSAWHSYS